MDIPYHPLAALIPPMSPDELEKLTADIAANGLLEPIVTLEGQILDGRHRWRACQISGIECRFEEYTGPDPVAFVLSKNLHRRHLSSAQKAAIAVEALPLLEKQARARQRQAGEQFGRGQEKVDKKIYQPMDEEEADRAPQSIDQAASLTGTNRQYVSDAKRIAENAPDVFAAMKSGTVSIPEAKALTQKPPEEREATLEALPDLSRADRKALLHVVPPPEAESEPEESSPLLGEEDDTETPLDHGSADLSPSSLSVHFTSDTPEWYTPSTVLERVIACLGEIDLDPCADPDHQVPSRAHFDNCNGHNDGLNQDWVGRVFMNPPYGREIDAWIAKLVEEFEAGQVKQAIALVPARVDTAWFRRLANFPVAFWRGRITFLSPAGEKNPAPFPSALVGLGVEPKDLAQAFDTVADV